MGFTKLGDTVPPDIPDIIKKDSVVQILPNENSPSCFHGCLMVIAKVKRWGYQGYVLVPEHMNELPTQAGYRVKRQDCLYIGEAQIVLTYEGHDEDDNSLR